LCARRLKTPFSCWCIVSSSISQADTLLRNDTMLDSAPLAETRSGRSASKDVKRAMQLAPQRRVDSPNSISKGYVMRFSNSSLAMVAALLLGFAGANATAQTYQAPTNQPRTDQAPGAKSDITRVQAGSDTSGVVAGQAKSGEPSIGAGSRQLPSPNSE